MICWCYPIMQYGWRFRENCNCNWVWNFVFYCSFHLIWKFIFTIWIWNGEQRLHTNMRISNVQMTRMIEVIILREEWDTHIHINSHPMEESVQLRCFNVIYIEKMFEMLSIKCKQVATSTTTATKQHASYFTISISFVTFGKWTKPHWLVYFGCSTPFSIHCRCYTFFVELNFTRSIFSHVNCIQYVQFVYICVLYTVVYL